MSLLSVNNASVAPQVGSEGPTDAQIAIIGEAFGAMEAKFGVPFQGTAGGVLNRCLQAAGIFRRHCYLDTYLRMQPPGRGIIDFFDDKRRVFTEKGWQAVEEMRARLPRNNITLPLGNTALAALTYRHPADKGRSVTQIRGYVTAGWDGRKILPTFDPVSTLYRAGRKGQIAQHIMVADFSKALRHADSPDIVRPQYNFYPEQMCSFSRLMTLLDAIKAGTEPLSVDIEVEQYEISCLCLAWSPNDCISIPFDSRWYLEETAAIWRKLCEILEDPARTIIMQNAIFDCYFLAMKWGIFVNGMLPGQALLQDTMIRHHIEHCEMQKSLGFLISLYGESAEYHKDMVKFENIKEES